MRRKNNSRNRDNGSDGTTLNNGDWFVCSNYRQDCTLNIAFQILSKVIKNRLWYAEEILGEYQEGYDKKIKYSQYIKH